MFLIVLHRGDHGLRIKMQPEQFCSFLNLPYNKVNPETTSHGKKPNTFNMPSNVDQLLATTLKDWFEACFGGTTSEPSTPFQIKQWKTLRSILSSGGYFPPNKQGFFDEDEQSESAKSKESDHDEEVGFGSPLVDDADEVEFNLPGPVRLPTGWDACDADELGSDDVNPKVVNEFFPPRKRQKTITLTSSNKVSGLTSSSYYYSSSSSFLTYDHPRSLG